jgi:Spy/CpxP family protein refolding chaperone
MKLHTALTRSTLASVLGGLALGMTLPAAAEPPADPQVAQAAPTPGTPQWGHRPDGGGQSMHGHHGWQRRGKAHHFSLARVALRHQKDLALTPAQIDSLRKLGTDSRRDAIKRQAEVRLARLDLSTLMMPDAADPNKPRDMARIEAKVRDIEKLRGDAKIAQIRTLEQSRQVLTPEQREKLRALMAQRWQQRGPQQVPGVRGMGPEEHGHQPTSAPETEGTSG